MRGTYYNEIDPYAAQWLRNLIAAGHIAAGDVDERSIAEVHPADLISYDQCHFFAGIGVWSYALRLAGWPDDRPVWTGSCPCQPFSAAGKCEGAADARHLWPEWFRLIREYRPVRIVGEQVGAAIRHGWLDLVSADLEGAGYAIGSAVVGAHSVGAPHIRQRLFFVADRDGSRRGTGRAGEAGDGRDAARVEPSGLCTIGELADAGCERGAGRGDVRDVGEAAAGDKGAREEWQRLRDTTDDGRATGELADADGGNAGAEGLQRSGEHGQQQEDGGAGGSVVNAESEQVGVSRRTRQPRGSGVALGDTFREGLSEQQRERGTSRDEGCAGARETFVGTGTPTAGFWSDADWLPCIDGKARPVEPGTFPLAHGAPARVGRLRAYGNAIVAPLAAEFIGAYMDIRPDSQRND